jgi:hypothetical protein
MEFKEDNDGWRATPSWVGFLVEFGYRWMCGHRGSRRIGLISMPADSAASGLIALGLMRKCLESEDAHDVAAHFQRLRTRLTRDAAVVLRHIQRDGRYVFDGLSPAGEPMVLKLRDRNRQRVNIHPSTAANWYVDGEAPAAIQEGNQAPYAPIYSQLVKTDGAILPANLIRSHSDVCLAGRAAGGAQTERWIANIRFRENELEAELSKLLLIQDWMPGTISRVRFFNARTRTFDREAGNPQVVVADGDASLLQILASRDFDECEVIGVVHRTMDREKLEGVGNRLSSLRQWYRQDYSLLGELGDIPRGVTISVLQRGA